jgi:hypothetical protein
MGFEVDEVAQVFMCPIPIIQSTRSSYEVGERDQIVPDKPGELDVTTLQQSKTIKGRILKILKTLEVNLKQLVGDLITVNVRQYLIPSESCICSDVCKVKFTLRPTVSQYVLVSSPI